MRRSTGPDRRAAVRGARSSALGALACALAFAGCGGSSKDRSTGATASDRAIPTFSWALSAAPSSLDLAKDGMIAQDAKIMSLVTEPLVRQTVTGGSIPNLATSVQQPTPTTIVYDIRSGVRFSDGQPLTADDVAWSLKHVTAPTSATASTLSGPPTVSVTGPLQVTVRFATHEASDRVELNGISYIQEASFARAHASQPRQPGCPADRQRALHATSSVTPQSITLVRNPYFRGPKPLVRTLVFPVIPEGTSAQLAMRQGSIQAATVGDLKTAGVVEGHRRRDAAVGGEHELQPALVRHLQASVQ